MYRWVEHTGEQELEIEAATEEDVFRDALQAFRELAGGAEGDPAGFAVSLPGSDRAVLLADWIAELAFLAETRGFVPREAERLELQPDRLDAELAGAVGSPAHLVKAATYHRLSFEPAGGGWRASVVLDV